MQSKEEWLIFFFGDMMKKYQILIPYETDIHKSMATPLLGCGAQCPHI
ncbi:hypothetical protein D1BOALGB6SA_6307 [Olavius sp. associated proteobacterium Delta 1]|nr:hypothetical protein D1BOALGB6SA_6307 [Olavius sp. associated proteobacterium Delta 1]